MSQGSCLVKRYILLGIVLLLGPQLAANELALTNRLHHLRNEQTREWSSFPQQAEATSLDVSFQLPGKPTNSTLRLRQQDVKQI